MAIGEVVGYLSDGSWLNLKNVVFNNNWDIFSVTYSTGATGANSISLYLDTMDSIIKFNGVANMDKIKFEAPNGPGASIISGGDFEVDISVV